MKKIALPAALLLLFAVLFPSCFQECEDPFLELPLFFIVEKSAPVEYADFLDEDGSITDLDGNELDWECLVVACSNVALYLEDNFSGGNTSETLLFNFPNGNVDTFRIEFSGARDECNEWIVNDDTEIFRNDSLFFTGDFRQQVFILKQ
jgi:hypothetical protein